MNILRSRAIKRYARELPRRLATDYGASKFYTPKQIERAAARLNLDANFIAYGHAMFLDEADFSLLNPTSASSYNALRIELVRHMPSAVTGNVELATGSYIGASGFGGAWGTFGPGGFGDSGCGPGGSGTCGF